MLISESGGKGGEWRFSKHHDAARIRSDDTPVVGRKKSPCPGAFATGHGLPFHLHHKSVVPPFHAPRFSLCQALVSGCNKISTGCPASASASIKWASSTSEAVASNNASCHDLSGTMARMAGVRP